MFIKSLINIVPIIALTDLFPNALYTGTWGFEILRTNEKQCTLPTQNHVKSELTLNNKLAHKLNNEVNILIIIDDD